MAHLYHQPYKNSININFGRNNFYNDYGYLVFSIKIFDLNLLLTSQKHFLKIYCLGRYIVVMGICKFYHLTKNYKQRSFGHTLTCTTIDFGETVTRPVASYENALL